MNQNIQQNNGGKYLNSLGIDWLSIIYINYSISLTFWITLLYFLINFILVDLLLLFLDSFFSFIFISFLAII